MRPILPNTKTRQMITGDYRPRPMFLMNKDAIIWNKIQTQWIQKHIKNHTLWLSGIYPRNTCLLLYMNQTIYLRRGQKSNLHLNGQKKHLTKFNSLSWLLKKKNPLSKLRSTDMSTSFYIANIILNNIRLKPFSQWSGTRQRSPLSPCPLDIILQLLDKAIRKEKEIKAARSGKKENHLY